MSPTYLFRIGAGVSIAAALFITGCASPAPTPAPSTTTTSRVPAGAATRRTAAEKFFAAYKAHDRQAAAQVASDAALNALIWNPQAGDNPTLQLTDTTHITYEGGSIELRLAQNAAGRWYVQSVRLHAD